MMLRTPVGPSLKRAGLTGAGICVRKRYHRKVDDSIFLPKKELSIPPSDDAASTEFCQTASAKRKGPARAECYNQNTLESRIILFESVVTH
jgi:hypothetical protein